MYKNLTSMLPLFLILCCGSSGPNFNEKAAFQYLLQQCEFGPRNPSSEGYYKCLDFMLSELEMTADDIIIQEFTYQEKKKRTRQLSHWRIEVKKRNDYPSFLLNV